MRDSKISGYVSTREPCQQRYQTIAPETLFKRRESNKGRRNQNRNVIFGSKSVNLEKK